jgi:hypothetical protein
LSGCGKGNKLGIFYGEGHLEAAYRVLNLTTSFEGNKGQRWKVSWCERPFPPYLVFNLAWLSRFLFLAVLPGVVTAREANVVPFPLAQQVMGNFHQLGEEPGEDGWEK